MIWNAFGNIVYLACQWFVTVMVTRVAGYEDAGILSLAMSISATFQTIALFGIRNYQVSDIDCKYSDSCYSGLRIVTCVVAMVLSMSFSLMNRYDATQLTAIFWFMVFRLAENYSDVLHGMAQKRDRLDIAGKSFLIKGIFSTAFFFAGYLAFHSLNIGLACMAMSSVITTVLYDWHAVKQMLSETSVSHNLTECMHLAKETAPLCAYMFVNSAIATVPKYILEKMCDEIALGAYSSIFAPALLIQAAAAYIYVPFTSKFAEYKKAEDYKSFHKLMMQIIGVIAVIAMVAIIGCVFLGEWGLKLIFGESIATYTNLLIPVVICTFTTSYLAYFGMLEVVIRDFKGLLIGCCIGLLICICTTPFFINLCGINGTSYGLILGSVAACVYLLGALMHKTQTKDS